MSLALIASIVTIILNFDKGFVFWTWPLATALWVLDAWVKSNTITELQNQIEKLKQ